MRIAISLVVKVTYITSIVRYAAGVLCDKAFAEVHIALLKWPNIAY